MQKPQRDKARVSYHTDAFCRDERQGRFADHCEEYLALRDYIFRRPVGTVRKKTAALLHLHISMIVLPLFGPGFQLTN